jgi:hypothetical protein
MTSPFRRKGGVTIPFRRRGGGGGTSVHLGVGVEVKGQVSI